MKLDGAIDAAMSSHGESSGFNSSQRESMGLISVKTKPRSFREAPPSMVLNSSSKLPKKQLDRISKDYRVGK
jgi:hypothetical protein